MANTQSFTDQIRDWFDRTPRAQRAVKRLSDDLDIVAGHVAHALSGLLERVGPIIDPPAAKMTVPEQADTTAESGGADQSSGPAIPESESSVPPGVRQDSEPVDPTS